MHSLIYHVRWLFRVVGDDRVWQWQDEEEEEEEKIISTEKQQ